MTHAAALVGCGRIATAPFQKEGPGVVSYLEAFRHTNRTKLVAVVDSDETRAAAAAKQMGLFRGFTRVESIAELKPELIIIAVSTAFHRETFEAVVKIPSVRMILIEKPVGGTSDQARAIHEMARERGISVLVHYSRRFAPRMRRLREEIQSGRWGTITHVNGGYTAGLIHNGTHWLDLARYFFGEIDVARRLDAQSDTPSVEMRINGSVHAVVNGLNGAEYTHFEMDLIGTRGRVRLTEFGHTLESYRVAESLRHPGYQWLELEEKVIGTALQNEPVHFLEHAIDCLEGKDDPWCGTSDAIRVLEIAEQVLKRNP